MRDLLWLGFDLGRCRASASATHDTFRFAIVTISAYLDWRSTCTTKIWLKSRIAFETRLIALQEVIKRVCNVRSLPCFVTGWQLVIVIYFGRTVHVYIHLQTGLFGELDQRGLPLFG